MPKLVRSLPFIALGKNKIQGLIRVDELDFIFEFEVGFFKKKVKEIRVLMDDIECVEFKKNIFKKLLVVTTHSLKILRDIPGNNCGKIEVYILKENVKIAEDLVRFWQLKSSENNINEML